MALVTSTITVAGYSLMHHVSQLSGTSKGLVVWLDGDGQPIVSSQTATLKALAQVANARGYHFAAPKTPFSNLQWWSAEDSLHDELARAYVDLMAGKFSAGRVHLIGYSGGTVAINKDLAKVGEWPAQWPGSALLIGGGSTTGAITTPVEWRSGYIMRWAVGTRDIEGAAGNVGWSAKSKAEDAMAEFKAAGHPAAIVYSDDDHYTYDFSGILDSHLAIVAPVDQPAPAPVAKSAVEVLTASMGAEAAAALVVAAYVLGIPLHIAAALVWKESRGKNVYGHDLGGIFSTAQGPVTIGDKTYAQGKDVPVTAENFPIFLERLAAGEKSNGVGLTQITYGPTIVALVAAGVDLADPLQNVQAGLQILAGYLKGSFGQTSVESAGTLYNAGNLSQGITAYGQALWIEAERFRLLLDGVVTNVYTVTAGQTLWSISQQYGVTAAAIKAANALSTDAVYVGQTLVIPAVTAVEEPDPIPAPVPDPSPAPITDPDPTPVPVPAPVPEPVDPVDPVEPAPDPVDDQVPDAPAAPDPAAEVTQDPGPLPVMRTMAAYVPAPLPTPTPGPVMEPTKLVSTSLRVLWRSQWWSVLSASVRRELSVPGPDQSPLGAVPVEATGDLLLARPLALSDKEWSAWAGDAPAPGERVYIEATRGYGSPWVPVFRGQVDEAAGSVLDGGVSLQVVDDMDALEGAFSHPPLNFRQPAPDDGRRYMSIGLHPAHFVNRIARRAGFFATPPAPAATTTVSVPMLGSMWPERGTIFSCKTMDAKGSDLGVTSDSPDYVQTWWGMSVTNVFARFRPAFQTAGAGQLNTPIGIRCLVDDVTDYMSLIELWWATAAVSVIVDNRGVVIETIDGLNALGDRRIVYRRVCPIPAEMKAAGFELTVWLTPEGWVDVAIGGQETRLPLIPAWPAQCKTTDMREVRITARPFSATLGGVVVVSSLSRSALGPWSRDFIPEVSTDHMIGGSPAIEGVTGLQLLRQQAEAELSSMWIDEEGVLRYVSRPHMDARPSKRTLTISDIQNPDWKISRDALVSHVDVKRKTPTLNQDRMNSRYGQTVWEGPKDSLQSGGTWQEIVNVPDGEDWLDPDLTFEEITSTTARAANKAIGSWMGATAVVEAEDTSTTTTKHTVVSGDTLYSLATKWGTTVTAISTANDLTSTNLPIGKVLTIPAAGTTTTTATTTQYTVVSGDTLYSLAAKWGTTVTAIQKASGLTTTALSIGQTLTIPTGTTTTTTPATTSTEDVETPAPGSWYYGKARQINLKALEITFGYAPPAGVTARLDLITPELPKLTKQLIGTGPTLRARGKQTWADVSLGTPRVASSSLRYRKVYEHDGDWFIQSPYVAARVADRLAQMMAAPLATHGPLVMGTVDLSIRLGDTITLRLEGMAKPHRVCGVKLTYDAAGGLVQSLTIRQLSP